MTATIGRARAIGMQACRCVLRAVLDEFDVEPLATEGTDFWTDVWLWLLEYADHEPDWADGCMAVRL